jgi:hypothetical protein
VTDDSIGEYDQTDAEEWSEDTVEGEPEFAAETESDS